MEKTRPDSHVAIYLDFDNIVMSRYDELHGRESFRNDKTTSRNPTALVKRRLDQARVDLQAITAYASSFGTVSIARAYANWSSAVNASYADDTLRRSIDLVQLFPMTGTKNGADIRLAIDVIDDLTRHDHISHVVVVAGDSDYVSLAQRCRRLGRRVIGVGASRSVGKYWESACDEFKYYGRLPGVLDVGGDALPEAPDVQQSDAAQTLANACRLMYSATESDWLPGSGLKVQMKRLDPTFDENTLGFRTFTAFLRSLPDVVDVDSRDSGTFVRIRDDEHLTASRTIDPAAPGPGIEPAMPPPDLAALRHRVGLATAVPLGVEGEHWCVRAMRAAWTLTAAANPPPDVVPAKAITAMLIQQGATEVLAKRATHQVASTGMPVLLRDPAMHVYPNAELALQDDLQLLRFFRQWIADRARNVHPEPVDARLVADVVHGDTAPADALVAYGRALAQASLDQQASSLRPVLLPPPVLGDVVAAISAVEPGRLLPTVDHVTAVLSEQLVAVERDPTTVSLPTAFLCMEHAGILSAADDGGIRISTDGMDSQDILAAIVRAWARQLLDSSLLHPAEMISMEAFYRLVLTDRYQADWRAWARATVATAAAG